MKLAKKAKKVKNTKWTELDNWPIEAFGSMGKSQDKAWKKATKKHPEYLAYFFIDEEGNLDFREMYTMMELMINNDCLDPFEDLSKRQTIPLGPRHLLDDCEWMMQLLHHLKQMSKGVHPVPSYMDEDDPALMKSQTEWPELDEWVIETFTFESDEQYDAWDEAISLRNKKHGEYLPRFFVDEKGSVDFDKMYHALDVMIGEGCMDPFEELYEETKIVIGPRPDDDRVWIAELEKWLGLDPDTYADCDEDAVACDGCDEDAVSYDDCDEDPDTDEDCNVHYDDDREDPFIDDDYEGDYDEWEDDGTVFRVRY